MARRPKQSTWISVQLSQSEKQILDDAAKAAGQSRNRFVRLWIATLLRRQGASG